MIWNIHGSNVLQDQQLQNIQCNNTSNINVSTVVQVGWLAGVVFVLSLLH